MNDLQLMLDAYKQAGGSELDLAADTPHLVVERNNILSRQQTKGLKVDVKPTARGIKALITVQEGTSVPKPVHLCFGVIPEEGLQKIDLDVVVEDGGEIEIIAHCTFPNAVRVKHVMDARIRLGNHCRYVYKETHYHGTNGGIEVIPKTEITIGRESFMQTVFMLPKGRAGNINIDYRAHIGAGSSLEMIAKINGYARDVIRIRESAVLAGNDSAGLLESRVALADEAQAEIINELTATAPGARGHVDCKEIIRDNARGKAIPVVDVRHPEAQVTHEAAIGSIDRTQLQTLMARGLTESEATEVILQGLLK